MNYLDIARRHLANSPPDPYAVNAVNAERGVPTDSGDTLPRLSRIPRNDSAITNPDQLAEVRHYLEASTIVGIDLETTGLNPRQDRIRLLSLSADGQTFVIDCFAVDPSPLFPVLGNLELVGHNLLFDLQFLAQLGFVPAKAFDTMLASQVLGAGCSSKHGLKDVAERYLNLPLDKTEQTADWAGPLTEDMIRYAALDAEVPLKLREAMLSQARQDHLEVIIDLENRCLLAVVSMSRNGVGFDAGAWRQLADEAEQRRQELEAQMNARVPLGEHLFGYGERNWDSPEQVKTAFAQLGVTLTSTADEDLAEVNHPLASLMREYRTLAKRTGTYGREWLRHVEGGRVYPMWRQCSTRSGRMSCSNPNMQQLPRDARYRRCFRAAPGHVLIKADYSQIELRLAAKIANEERMIEAYQRGEDLHTKTAQAILGKTEVTKSDRQLAKAINFGLLYGMGAKMFALYARVNYGVDLTEEQAKTYREKFFATYPGLARWHRKQAGKTSGRPVMTWTILGRRRLDVLQYTEKLNTPVQGSGADGLKAALALCWQRRSECPSAKLVLAVHDEIVIEVPQADAEQARDWLVRCMMGGMQPLLDPVPCVVEATIAPTWGG
jgi:DNA polymerase-1